MWVSAAARLSDSASKYYLFLNSVCRPCFEIDSSWLFAGAPSAQSVSTLQVPFVLQGSYKTHAMLRVTGNSLMLRAQTPACIYLLGAGEYPTDSPCSASVRVLATSIANTGPLGAWATTMCPAGGNRDTFGGCASVPGACQWAGAASN